MKKNEIRVGGHYVAKVSGKLTTVRVDAIRDWESSIRSGNGSRTSYDVTNLATGRKTTFRSAAKFRSVFSHGDFPAMPGDPKEGPPPAKDEVCDSEDWHADEQVREEEHADGFNVGRRVIFIGPEYVHSDGPTIGERGVIVERSGGYAHPVGGEKEELITVKFSLCVKATLLGIRRIRLEDEQRADPTLVASAEAERVGQPAAAPSLPSNVLGSNLNGVLARLANQTTDDAPHLIVEARAGTGKTTTLVEGLKVVMGQRSLLTPSPQQQAVWDCMALSRGKAKTICFVAFNKSIATELQRRVPQGVDAMTMHSMGMRAVRKYNPRVQVNEWRVKDILAEMLGGNFHDLRKNPATLALMNSVEELVGLCKVNLCDGSPDELDHLVDHYDVDVNGSRDRAYSLVPKVLEKCKDPSDNKIDFNDMIWLPVVLKLNVQKYDMLLVDEAQDLNRCQQALAKMAGRRLILCGDPRQAIYGFAGADADSMPNMNNDLSSESRGCVVLPLTVTRRCGHAIVAEANTIVADFSAHETNPAGLVSEMLYPTDQDGKERLPRKAVGEDGAEVVVPIYTSEVRDGDMVLCRTNAPLVSQCFRFLKAGRKANIQGRDIGRGLVSTVKKLNAADLPELVAKLEAWVGRECAKENAKKNPSDARLIAIQDRADCISAFMSGAASVAGVIAKIESVFTDDKDRPGVRLSSIHRAKGLEADRVFFLMPKGGECPHPMAKSEWQRGQEMNLKYVAVTRAIRELVYVY